MKIIKSHLFIFLSLILIVFAQVAFKFQTVKISIDLERLTDFTYLLQLALSPWILMGVIAIIISTLFWMVAMRHFDQSYAYPFVSLNYIFIFFISAILFNEPITILRLSGILLITIGVFITSISK